MNDTNQSPKPSDSEMLKLIYKELIDLKRNILHTNSSEEFVDIETICKTLKISKDSLRRYRKQKLIPYHKMKGKIYFLESEVREALKKHYYGG